MNQILVRSERCLGCKTCELECKIVHSSAQNLIGAVAGGEKPVGLVHVHTDSARSINLPLQCRQCTEAKCVLACMTGAMHVDKVTGLVVNNEEKCVGCWMCVMVCPYGIISQSENQKVAKKCDQCLSAGHEPACVKGCPTKALTFGAVHEFNRETRHKFLTRFIQGEEV